MIGRGYIGDEPEELSAEAIRLALFRKGEFKVYNDVESWLLIDATEHIPFTKEQVANVCKLISEPIEATLKKRNMLVIVLTSQEGQIWHRPSRTP